MNNCFELISVLLSSSNKVNQKIHGVLEKLYKEDYENFKVVFMQLSSYINEYSSDIARFLKDYES